MKWQLKKLVLIGPKRTLVYEVFDLIRKKLQLHLNCLGHWECGAIMILERTRHTFFALWNILCDGRKKRCYLSLLVKEMNCSPWVSIDHQTYIVGDGYNELRYV